ncbi:hypothetical protein CAPTEDRAFT_168958 [Capitella teleta]|uniref:CHCH domain-containing protein n=1 Tax=Capitella teleta TaxID=283909 RepID=R7T6P9_CAPTE|nr:hypothetical protein CAPTEDRAFT_168958 [Capitella teleta]|eukprot:ELT89200.1 hypothetical protein CAPTEDRAFT_168958 [Capitella teleta]
MLIWLMVSYRYTPPPPPQSKPSSPSEQAPLSGPVEAIAREIQAEELQRLKDFYERRLQSLENNNKELYQTTTEQFAHAVEEVESKFLKATQPPICQGLEEAVMKCYQQNPKQTLLCSAEVKAFAACVQSQREKVLSKKGG